MPVSGHSSAAAAGVNKSEFLPSLQTEADPTLGGSSQEKRGTPSTSTYSNERMMRDAVPFSPPALHHSPLFLACYAQWPVKTSIRPRPPPPPSFSLPEHAAESTNQTEWKRCIIKKCLGSGLFRRWWLWGSHFLCPYPTYQSMGALPTTSRWN